LANDVFSDSLLAYTDNDTFLRSLLRWTTSGQACQLQIYLPVTVK